VPARLGLAGRRLLITISDARAISPLRIDPTIEQTGELTASDGAASDFFGYSVAVSGSTIAVGARGHAVGANAAQGAVYVFTEPASGVWANATQSAELTASDGAASDSLGSSVAVSGTTIAAGAPSHDGGDGAVYVFAEPASGGWANATQTAELTASDGEAYDFLGSSVALSGGTVVAGAPDHEVGVNALQGAVYVYSQPAGGWADASQSAELTASDGAANDRLGTAVAASGSTLAAGAPDHDSLRGAVYVYSQPSGGWADATQSAELTASNAVAGHLCVTGPLEDAAASTANTPGACVAGSELGASVAASGATIVAGAPGTGSLAGAAYVFSEPASGWSDATESAELVASDGATGTTCVAGTREALEDAPACDVGDQLGRSAGVSGSTIVAGAPNHEIGSDALQGAAYAFAAVTSQTIGISLSPASIAADGTSTTTATVTVTDTSGNPISDHSISVTSSGGQAIGAVTPGPQPGTYRATITSTTLGGSSTITASDGSVTPNATATATLTQTTSNAFTWSGAGSGGTLSLNVDVPGPGSVDVLGTHGVGSGGGAGASSARAALHPGHHRYATCRASVTVTKAGRVRIKLHLNKRARHMLRSARRHGWAVHIRVSVTYTPNGGRPHTRTAVIRVLKAARRT
jgi:FG-GAP repeat/Invasin, domain 3